MSNLGSCTVLLLFVCFLVSPHRKVANCSRSSKKKMKQQRLSEYLVLIGAFASRLLVVVIMQNGGLFLRTFQREFNVGAALVGCLGSLPRATRSFTGKCLLFTPSAGANEFLPFRSVLRKPSEFIPCLSNLCHMVCHYFLFPGHVNTAAMSTPILLLNTEYMA